MPLQVEQDKIEIIDTDVYGRTASNGGALIHLGDLAISNAMIFFLTLDKNEMLYEPNVGGLFQLNLFKLLTPDRTSDLEKKLKEQLNRFFGKVAEEIEVLVNPNYSSYSMEVDIFWTSRETKKTNEVPFLVLKQSANTSTTKNKNNYIQIDFTGDNLLAFVVLELDKMIGLKLEFDTIKGHWIWGRTYEFTNFSADSANFEEIKTTINTNG